MKALLFALLFYAGYCAADPQAAVWSREPSSVRKFFPAKTYKMLDADSEAEELAESGYLQPQERAALFHKLKLDDSVAALDEVNKDMLVMGARFESLKVLVKHYPMLSRTQLIKLQQEIKLRAGNP